MISIYVNRQPKSWLTFWLLFFSLTLLYVGLNIWLTKHGFASDFNAHRWSKVITAFDADEFRLEHVGLLYPHGPIYLLALLYSLLGIDSVQAATGLSAILLAVMFGLWNRHLWHKGYSQRARIAMLALLALHPFSLWAASSGLHNTLVLFTFYLFCYGCYLVISIHDLRAVVLIAFMLAVLFFVDERTSILFLALLPLIPFLAPKRMLGSSLIGVYSILLFPLAVTAGGWIYLNWVFHSNPWEFIQASEASFRGAFSQTESSPWLSRLGGQWLAPASWGLVFTIMAFPFIPWVAWRCRHHRVRMAATLALFLHPVIAIALATSIFFLSDLLNLLFLQVAIVMATILLMPRVRQAKFLLILLAVGNLGGWLALSWLPSDETRNWSSALAGNHQAAHDDLTELGLWLKDLQQPTLMDDRQLYRTIVACGHAHNLVLPFSHQFKNEMKRLQPITEQVVVANPGRPVAAMDRVTQQFPELFWQGAPDYSLVYDTGDWRVWRRPPQLPQQPQQPATPTP